MKLRWSFCCLALTLSTPAIDGFTFVSKNSLPAGTTISGTSGSSLLASVNSPDDVLWTPSYKSGARDEQFGPITQYCPSLNEAVRRKSRTVTCGPIKFGSEHPIVKQTMATTDTSNVEATIEQIIRCADEGFDLVRITVQGMREANACLKIREGLDKRGYNIPLCADMHFQPKVAMKVAEAVEKIRINPGNFVDGTKDFEDKIYETEEDYNMARENIITSFVPLVEKCKELNRAMRIGTNHGSLSSRVLSFYGDTPRGMVESAIEFADIARACDYHNFVFSMKASNPLVMVQAYRLLAAEQYRLGWDYPLHLGVTEAGEGEDGRMKSAIGIGTLLADGLGDTVRVSLTEDPEFEYEPCSRLISLSGEQLSSNKDAKDRQEAVEPYVDTRDFQSYSRRHGNVENLGTVNEGMGEQWEGSWLSKDGSVLSVVSGDMFSEANAQYLYKELGMKTALGMPFRDVASTDSLFLTSLPKEEDMLYLKRLQEIGVGVAAPAELFDGTLENGIAVMNASDAVGVELPTGASRLAAVVDGTESLETFEKLLKDCDPAWLFLKISPSLSTLHGSRRVFEILKMLDSDIPVIHYFSTNVTDKNELALRMGTSIGSLLSDGNGDGVLVHSLEESNPFSVDFLRQTSFGLLQGCRMRNTKTEFVSCPSCGRTLFDLQETTARIQEATGHLPGVTVAVMGCIVNGPGEMADADFGYVGTTPGMVDLYYGKEVVKKRIPNDDAVEALIELIKEYGMWKEKETEEEEALVEA